MNVIWGTAGVLMGIAAVITMYRLLAGPSTLDRLVALDTLAAMTVGGIGIWAAASRDTTVTYGLAALSLVGFIGTVSVARFRVPDDSAAPGRRP